MQCPVCSSTSGVYGGRDYGATRLRYRKCTSCGHKFKTFEEVDLGQKVRHYERWPEIEAPASGVTLCPSCSNETKPIGQGRWDQTTRRYHFCVPCNRGVCFVSRGADPIGQRIEEIAAAKRVSCPKCGEAAWSRGKNASAAKFKCTACDHRFKVPFGTQSASPAPTEFVEQPIGHRVVP